MNLVWKPRKRRDWWELGQCWGPSWEAVWGSLGSVGHETLLVPWASSLSLLCLPLAREVWDLLR